MFSHFAFSLFLSFRIWNITMTSDWFEPMKLKGVTYCMTSESPFCYQINEHRHGGILKGRKYTRVGLHSSR